MTTLKDKFLESVLESEGSKDFRHYYIRKGDQWIDVSKNGKLSCAIFVSRKLSEFSRLINSAHATVESTVADLEKSGWHKIENIRPGAVIVWEKVLRNDGKEHSHIGFALDDKTAMSNNGFQGIPWKHHITNFDEELGQGENVPERKIDFIYWHESLNEQVE